MKIKLSQHEHIVTVYAEPAAGPGWANNPLWVVITDRSLGTMRREAIQPTEQTAVMNALYSVSVATHGQLMREVERHFVAKKRTRRTSH